MELERRRAPAWAGTAAAFHRATLPLVVFIAAFLPAATLALKQPAWSRVDEAQHYDFIVQLASGTWPVADSTTLRRPTIGVMDRTGIYRWFQPNGDAQPTDTDPSQFHQPPPQMAGKARSQWFWRHIWYFSYEAFQPPLYYLLLAPVWLAGNAAGGPLAAVYLLRMVNALLVAGLAPAALLLAREVLPGRTGFALAAAAAAVAVPGLLINLTQVTNDTLAALLGSVLVLLAVRFQRTGLDLRKALLLGALLGAAALTKLTVLGLVPALMVAVLVRRPRLAPVVVATAAFLLAPWVMLNEHIYGHPLPPHEFMSAVFRADPMSPHLLRADLGHALLTYWSGEPVGVAPLSNTLVQFAAVWTLVACIGLALLVARGLPHPPLTLLVAALAVGGEAALAIAMPVFSQVGGLTPGRYLYPAATAVAVLLAAGTWSLLPLPPLRASLLVLAAGLSMASLVGYAEGQGGDRHQLMARYSPPPGEGVPVGASGTFAGARVAVDRFLDDGARGDAWVHVVVDNPTATDIEWWPRPLLALDGRPPVRTDYGRSEPLPETVHAGAHREAWLVARTAAGGPRRHLDVTFEAVAAREYRVLGTLTMEADLPPP